MLVNGTIQRQRRPRRHLHRALVQHRQRPRKPQANRAGVAVRRIAEPRGAAAENLRIGQKLHVHFQPDHRLVLGPHSMNFEVIEGAEIYCIRIFSKNASARGSCDCPSQNIACLRTSRLWLVCATSINLGTPWSFGNWLNAKTAFFLTSVSGSFSIAPVIAPIAFCPALCASQNNACPRTCELWSSCAMRIISSIAPCS